MDIDGAFDKSIAQRILALNSNIRKNRERVAELHQTFADSIANARLIGVWRFTLSLAIPVIIATIGLHTHPGHGFEPADWRRLIYAAVVFYFVGGIGTRLRWRRDISGSDASYVVKELLIKHCEILDVVYRVDDLSGKASDLDNGLVVDDRVDVSPADDQSLKRLVGSYDTLLFVASIKTLTYKDCSADEMPGARLLDDSIESSRRYLNELLRSRPWLNKYIQLLRH